MDSSDDACPVCRHAGMTPAAEGRVWRWQDRTYRLTACPACGCAHSDPLPDDVVLQDYYRRCFDYRWYEDHYAAKLEDARRRVREYLPFLLGNRILDYGGGRGYLSQALREAGRESVTFDPYAAEQDPGAAWDALVSLHALEHASDPEALVLEMKRYLRPGGRLLLAVPNFDALGYRRFGMAWVWAQPPIVHVYHFTARGLTALMERLGFRVVHCRYAERWDANRVADIERRDRTVRSDQLWALPPFNRWRFYRRLVARSNAHLRFAALARAEAEPLEPPEARAELEILVILPDAG